MNMKLQICSLVVLLSWLVFVPLFVVGECTCDAQEQEEGTDVKKALTLKLVAIASILFASALGVGLPTFCKGIPALAPESDVFILVKAFAAGIILSTAFIHILPDAFENLSSPCLNPNPWGAFPFTGLITMVAAILTLMVHTIATMYYSSRSQVTSALPINNKPDDDEQPSNSGGHIHMHGHGHSHSHTLLSEEDSAATLDRHRVISWVLEAGIAVHSVIIGITVGVSQSPLTIKPLMIALVFHQLFEGMGLGGCLVQARFKLLKLFLMGLIFTITTPGGIAIGIGLSKVYSDSSHAALILILQGVFNAAASGILIHMGLVDLIAADFMSPKLMSSWKLMAEAYASLFVGMGCMSVLAKWA